MGAALQAELRRLTTTRMWWILLLVMIAYLAFVSAVIAVSFSGVLGAEGSPGQLMSAEESALATYSIVNPIGYVFPLLVGSLVFTTEFRHQTITGSLLVQPSRSILVGAKLVFGAVLGLVFGAVAAVSVVATGAPVLSLLGDGAFLGSRETWSMLLWTLVAFAAWASIGVAFGGLVKNQVVAIVAILAFTQFVEPIARTVGAAIESVSSIAQFLPGAAADAVIGASLFASMSGDGAADGLSRWAGLLVMLAYTALFAVLARVVTLRKDIA